MKLVVNNEKKKNTELKRLVKWFKLVPFIAMLGIGSLFVCLLLEILILIRLN